MPTFEQCKKTEAGVALPDHLFTKKEMEAIILDCYLQVGSVSDYATPGLAMKNFGILGWDSEFRNGCIFLEFYIPLESGNKICFTFKKARKLIADGTPEVLNLEADGNDKITVTISILTHNNQEGISVENEQDKTDYVQFLLDKLQSARRAQSNVQSKRFQGTMKCTVQGILREARKAPGKNA